MVVAPGESRSPETCCAHPQVQLRARKLAPTSILRPIFIVECLSARNGDGMNIIIRLITDSHNAQYVGEKSDGCVVEQGIPSLLPMALPCRHGGVPSRADDDAEFPWRSICLHFAKLVIQPKTLTPDRRTCSTVGRTRFRVVSCNFLRYRGPCRAIRSFCSRTRPPRASIRYPRDVWHETLGPWDHLRQFVTAIARLHSPGLQRAPYRP